MIYYECEICQIYTTIESVCPVCGEDLRSILPPGQLKQSDLSRKEIYERDGNKCVICDATEDLTIDHIIPKSKGGDNSALNKVTMCQYHNNEKGNMLHAYVHEISEHFRSLGLPDPYKRTQNGPVPNRRRAWGHDYYEPKPRLGKKGKKPRYLTVVVFQWVPTVSGKNLRKSGVKVRITGRISQREAVYSKAREICLLLNSGIYTGYSKVTVT